MKEHLALTNLRDNKVFPTFMGCPHEKEIPYPVYSDCYEPEEGLCFPISHQCFLGEITETVVSSRPGLKVKDITGQVVTVHFDFYSNDSGRALARFAPEMLNSLVQRTVPKSLTKMGNTIAILYAMRHDFEDGSVGFRIEHANQVQLFAGTLDRFLTLGDRILSSEVCQSDGVQACYKCNKTASRRCSGCHVTWYCGEDCQAGDWSGGGHKKDCTLLNEVATVMKQNWEHDPSVFRFPLTKG